MFTQLSQELGMNAGLLTVLIIWSLVWKGLGLWKAARRGEKIWFVVLLVVNLVGLLEMLYIFVITKWIDLRKKRGNVESQ